MWLGEAPISLMLETSLVHPHTIVSMLINDLADIDNEGFHSVSTAGRAIRSV